MRVLLHLHERLAQPRVTDREQAWTTFEFFVSFLSETIKTPPVFRGMLVVEGNVK